MFKRLFGLALLAFVVFLPLQTLKAQAPTTDPIVFAILFYSPTCPHCHDVMDNHLPPLQAQFGDQLQVLLINVQTQAGGRLFYAACDAFDLAGRCGGVPMMAVGSTLLFGAREIPARLPGIINSGLQSGGLPLPDLPGMQAAYDAWAGGQSAPNPELQAAASLSIWDKLAADPEGNAAAVVVLVGLVLSIGAVVWMGFAGRLQTLNFIGGLLFVMAAAGALLALSIIISAAFEDSFALITAWGVLLLMSLAMAVLPNETRRERFGIPLIALAGAAVALYLAYVEGTATEAMCGAIGNCNAVQQSDYARLFGVPVGMVGLIGYAAVLLAWAGTRLSKGETRRLYQAALLLLAGVGVLFSVYLTFLEPFVIGATCAWCLMSAVTMLLLLWLAAPAGWQAWHEWLKRQPKRKTQGRITRA